ncbi:MAG: carboxylesterase family protein [bacterium]|nr:carboxylesterase family protein [bacterium]
MNRSWGARHVGRGLLAVVALGVVAGCASTPDEVPATADPDALRTLLQGELVGFATEDGAHAWQGIPFAKPPVGNLRWRAPRPPEPWSGRLEALLHGPSCTQFASPAGGRDGVKPGGVTGSEDCLYLNVYTPKFTPESIPTGDERLPVMVWIHGGGNTIGDAVPYDGSLLATQQKLVVVTVHYRLGILGWFSHPALRPPGTSPEDASGNYGTLDLARSLAWVKKNIARFGGDPDRVTVFGESAGGSNVFSMLLSPAANGLFHGAIAQSGSAITRPVSEAENFHDAQQPGDPWSSSEIVLRHLIRDGQANDRGEAKAQIAGMSGSEIARYLHGKSPAQLLAVFDSSGFGGMYPSVELLRDGAVLPLEPAVEALKLGEYNQVPAILGTNRDEARLFQLFSSPHVASLGRFPLWLKDADLFRANADHPSRMWKLRGVDAPASAMREIQGASVFGYRFDWDEEPRFMFLDVSAALGAAHAIEIPFVFGWLTLGPGTRFVFDEGKADANRWLSDQIMSYWAQFAYSGNPGRGRSGDQAPWKSWSGAGGGGETFIVLDSQAGGGVRMSRDAALTRERVIAEVARDQRLRDHPRARCEIYYQFSTFGQGMTSEEYAVVEEGRCGSDYPYEAYPWES